VIQFNARRKYAKTLFGYIRLDDGSNGFTDGRRARQFIRCDQRFIKQTLNGITRTTGFGGQRRIRECH